MKDYEQLVKALRCEGMSKRCDTCTYGYRIYPDSECNDACHVEQIIDDAAAAIEALQAQLPKRGEWISDRLVTTNGGTYGVRRCSVCEAYYQDVGYGWNFCPNCGAKMEVQE